MYLNSNKPILTDNNSENFENLLTYIETLKEEISFSIETLSKKINTIKNLTKKSDGGES